MKDQLVIGQTYHVRFRTKRGRLINITAVVEGMEDDVDEHVVFRLINTTVKIQQERIIEARPVE